MPESAAVSTLRAETLRIAVAGNPNSGKTTVFNALSGLRHKVGNYPGVTVEKREGRIPGTPLLLLDLPGTYGLSARSPDEEIARDVLLGRVAGAGRPDGILLVVDAANLERNLYLVSQVLEFGIPTIIACNMMDIARARGIAPDCNILSKELGVPVIPVSADRGEGVDRIREALNDITAHTPPLRTWRVNDAVESAIANIARIMEASAAVPARSVRGSAMLWLSDYLSGEETAGQAARRFLDRLQHAYALELRDLADALGRDNNDVTAEVIERRYAWISAVAERAVGRRLSGASVDVARERPISDRIDGVLTHRVWGMLVFAGVVFCVFMSVFSWAEPLMGLIESGREACAGWIGSHMADGPLRSLIVDGVIAGVGSVVVFFPQICLMFLIVAILEDSGYMARAAFIMDRLMGRVGLAGKSFIPLVSSYACAIPGIMATRTIENRRDRFTTILVAPLMSCSARLPVYLILIAAVFGDRTWLKAGVLFGLYLVGTIAAFVMALIFKRTIFAGPRPTFIMELPPYHVPRLSIVLRTVWDRSRVFLTNAGSIIFAVCVLVWALSYFPRLDASKLPADARAKLVAVEKGDDGAREAILAAEQMRQSYIGRLGHFIEPVIKPLGYDWRLGAGILSSFLAREVFVGTMGITFAVGEADEESGELRDKLASATWPDGRIVLTPLVGVGLMVFYVLACQCVSTLAIVKRETNSWRWPAFLLAYMTALAYVSALLIYQIGTRLS